MHAWLYNHWITHVAKRGQPVSVGTHTPMHVLHVERPFKLDIHRSVIWLGSSHEWCGRNHGRRTLANWWRNSAPGPVNGMLCATTLQNNSAWGDDKLTGERGKNGTRDQATETLKVRYVCGIPPTGNVARQKRARLPERPNCINNTRCWPSASDARVWTSVYEYKVERLRSCSYSLITAEFGTVAIPNKRGMILLMRKALGCWCDWGVSSLFRF